MKANGAVAQRLTSHMVAQYQYAIRWRRGKGSWTAWTVGLPVIAMDGTKEKTRRRLYRGIQSHLECLLERGLPLPPPPRKVQAPFEVYAVSVWRS